MNIISYSDFSSKIHSHTRKQRIPFDASIDLTYRCNNRCVHCYCNLPDHDPAAESNELATVEINKLLDDLKALGSLWLLITGGEPLLRDDFEDIYLYAKKRGFLITLFTNGTKIDKGTADLLSKYPPFLVEISLYGATRETYEKVTRVSGSHERCMEGIQRILGAGIKLRLKSMALTINRHEIEAMDKMSQRLGCEFRFDPILNKRIDDNNFSDPVKYRITPEDVVRLDKTFPKRMDEWKKFCDKFVGGVKRGDRLYKCGAGIGMIHVSPYGIAKGCLMNRDGFSIRGNDLKRIWDKMIFSSVSRKKTFPLPCDDCNLENLCGQCAAWSVLENDDISREVPYLCGIARARKKAFEFIPAKQS